MRTIAITVFAAAMLAAAGAAHAQSDLAKANGCTNCHNGNMELSKVVAKHKGKPDEIKAAIDKVASGKGHAPVKAKPEDIKAIVEAAAK
jgi:cytochrome c